MNKEIKETANDLLAAWDNGVERALDNAARAEELAEQQLNNVAGLRVESGLRGGLWGATEGSCTTCNKFTCLC